MTDHDAQQHLDRLADDITSPLPPGLLDAARAARNRRRRTRLAVAGGVTALVVVGAGVPALSWVRDETISVTSSGRAGVPASRPVTDRVDVLGEWTVTEVEGGPVPSDAIRELQVTPDGDQGVTLGYDDGVNSRFRQVEITPDGALAGDTVGSTAVGCADPYDDCTRPSGFGVDDAVALRLTPDDTLVLVGADDSALAIYQRAD